jgi:hypothetical protein
MNNVPYSMKDGASCPINPPNADSGGNLCWDYVAFANLPNPGPNQPTYTGGQVIWPPNLILPECFLP